MGKGLTIFGAVLGVILAFSILYIWINNSHLVGISGSASSTAYSTSIYTTSTSSKPITTTIPTSRPSSLLILTNSTGGKVLQNTQTGAIINISLTPSSLGLVPLTQQTYQQVVAANSRNTNFGIYGKQDNYSGPGIYTDAQDNNYAISNLTQYLAINPTSKKVFQINKYGTIINISAVPNQGYIFNGWTCNGNNCYSGPNQNATITMNNNLSEIANFRLKSGFYYLNVLANISAGSLIGSGVYTNGTVINISETPQQGYIFAGWSCHGWGCYTGSGKSCGSVGSSCVSITMHGNITEIADYQSGAPYNGLCKGCEQYTLTTTQTTTTIPASAYSFNSPISPGTLTVGQTIDNQGDNFTLTGVILTNGVPEANITVVCYHQGYPVPDPSYSCPSGACQWYTGYIGYYWIFPTLSHNLDYGNACNDESIYVSHVNWSPNVSDQWAVIQIG